MALFTTATASDMARKSHQARRDAIDALRIAANPIPQPDPDDYTSRRLYRVREQVERLSDMLDEETDPQRLDRLACALARVSEIERQLAGRPMPGSRRPAPEVDPAQAARSSRPSATPMGAAPPAPASVPQANQAPAPSPAPGLPAPPQALEL